MVKKTEKQQLSLLDLFPKADNILTINDNRPAAITYISYSQFQTFEMCPLHYKLRYILKIPTSQTSAQAFGSSVHATLRDFYQHHLKDNTIETTQEQIRKLLAENWINEGYASKAHEQVAFQRGIESIYNYLLANFHSNHKPLALELPFQFFIKNLRIGGRIDRIDSIANNAIEIIDYKTGDMIPTEKEIQKNFQLSLYALAATEIRDPLFHREPDYIQLSLYYLEHGKKLTTTRTKEQLETAKEEIIERVATITKSDFLCAGTSLCLNCEYKMLCQIH